jgi:hypothetical protein
LGGHLYRIPEVVPTTVPPKKCRKGSISYCKIQLLHNLFKRRTKGHCNHYSLAPSTFYPTEAGRQGCNKVQRFLLHITSSHVSRLVEQPQPQQVRDRFPQTEQRDVSSKTSSSPRCRFNKCFSLSPGNSTQWRPLLPKEGGLIQVDIGGHPPFPNGSKRLSGNFGNLLFLAGFNFRGHFEGLNEGFLRSRFSMIA